MRTKDNIHGKNEKHTKIFVTRRLVELPHQNSLIEQIMITHQATLHFRHIASLKMQWDWKCHNFHHQRPTIDFTMDFAFKNEKFLAIRILLDGYTARRSPLMSKDVTTPIFPLSNHDNVKHALELVQLSQS